jgi:diguanylate cyclase (GGDEF)-like protein/PAS domain S-box-containing protein
MRNANFSTAIIKPVLGGVVLLNVAVVLFSTFTLYQSKQQAEQQAVTNTQNLSYVLEKSISGLIDKIDLVLLVSADEIQSQITAGKEDPHKITHFLKLQQERVPDIYNLRITDEKGMLRYGSDLYQVPVVDYADRDYFLHQRDNPEAGLYIAKPVFGKTTNKWLLVLSRRINAPDGSFAGVVYGSISLEHISELMEIDIELYDTITLRDGELGIIATSGGFQLAGNIIGSKKLSEPFKDALKKNPNLGTYTSGITSMDHINRKHSYRKFEKYPLYINAGITQKAYLASWHNQILETGGLILALMLSSAAFSFMLIRLLNRQISYEEALFQQKEYLQAIFETEPECVKITAPDGSLLDMNPVGYEMLEVDNLQEAQQMGLLAFVSPDYHQAFKDLRTNVFAGNHGTLEFQMKGKKGTTRWLETHAVPQRDEHGKIVSMLSVTRDITEKKSLLHELEKQAHIDYLTGVNNRRYFMQQAELELARTKRYNTHLSILTMDIDLFKQVNDNYGHKVGDQVLKKLAAICSEALREIDIIGRVGGEEFAILLPETDKTNALDAAERLRAAIADNLIPIENGLPIRMTVSIGVASLTSNDDNLDVLLSQSDEALYEAKKSGRNKVCCYTENKLK